MISRRILTAVFGPDAVLFKHPLRDPQRGFEISGGSLGIGLGYAAKLQFKTLKKKIFLLAFFVFLGDGRGVTRFQESAAFISHNQLPT